jgi:serine protease
VRSAAARLTRLAAAGVVAGLLAVSSAPAAPFMPNDPGTTGRPGGWAAQQWNFAGPYGVRAPEAWEQLIAAGRPGGAGVTVAVIDGGVAYASRGRLRRSPDLAATQFVAGYDFVGDDDFPYDRTGHGTHVASTIAEATNNGVGLTGLAYGARIMPVRVLNSKGEGSSRRIAQGIRFAAAHGAKIMNLSLDFAPQVEARQIRVLLRALAYAYRRGSLVVASAGNMSLGAVNYPARAPHVLAVGATTEHGCLAGFSNRGRWLDLVAPGGGADAALSGDPGCVARRPGRAIYQLTLQGRRLSAFGVPRDFVGTSMAAPHVSATAALVVASGVLGPDPSPEAIEHRLESSARDLGAPGYDGRYGWGLVDAAAATAP